MGTKPKITMQKVVFLDCESAGLRGTIFSAAMVDEDNNILFDGFYRHPDLQTNPFLMENVAPNLTGTEFYTLLGFQVSFAQAYKDAGSPSIVAHCGSPVESNLFQQLFEVGLIFEFGGPFPQLDTSPLLFKAGFDPTKELAYCEAKGIALPGGKPHSALFDARVTRLVWQSF